MRGLPIATTLLVCALIAGCGGSSGNTTIINNNQTTVTTAAGSTSTVAPTTTTPAPPPPESTTPENASKPEEPPKPKPGPIACGDPGIVTGGTAATTGSPAKPGFANLEAEEVSCAVAASTAAAFANGFEVSSCGAGCVKKLGDLRCRYAGSGSAVGCYGAKDQQLEFELSFPN